MRSATVAAFAALAVALLFSRKASATGRGDYTSEIEPLDPLEYLPPVEPDPLGWWQVNNDNDPVYDPRDVLSRRFDPAMMVPSEELAAWLRAKEKFVGKRYELGDGGVTIGYGWFEPYSRAHLMPQTITEPEARVKFAEHIETRGAHWVRLYVSTPLTQNEFDALVSMAFNLSPQSFRQIADALNSGGDWQAVAMRFTRPGTNLERGLINRRNAEVAIFENGVYA
jgi:GH24 family phage-related lysozyme (muramidase)